MLTIEIEFLKYKNKKTKFLEIKIERLNSKYIKKILGIRE